MLQQLENSKNGQIFLLFHVARGVPIRKIYFISPPLLIQLDDKFEHPIEQTCNTTIRSEDSEHRLLPIVMVYKYNCNTFNNKNTIPLFLILFLFLR